MSNRGKAPIQSARSMKVDLKAIESRVDFPVATTEPRLAAILDRLTLALGEHLKRHVQMGRAQTDGGALEFAVWIPGESFTGVLVSLIDDGKAAQLKERAVSSQADQVLHTALGTHLSSLEGSRLSVGDGTVKPEGYESALDEQWNDRWLGFVKAVRGGKGDVNLTVVDGEVVLKRKELATLPTDDVKAFQGLYGLIEAEVKRRNA
jgi:hypothetical protein